MVAFSGAGAFCGMFWAIPGTGPTLAFSGIGFFLPHHRLMCPSCLHLKQALLAIRSAFSLSNSCVNPPHLSPASRVENHIAVVWLWTGVSSGNWPTNVLKSRKYCVHRLKARMLGVSGMPVSDAVGKLRDLGDRLSNKIRTLICLDWDPYSMFPF